MQTPDWPTFKRIPLDPSEAEWEELTHQIQSVLKEELAALGELPVLDRDAQAQLLPDMPLEDWLRYLIGNGFNTAHPGFLAFIPGGGLVTSALADWFVKTTNRYGTANFASPLLAQLEYRVIQTFAAWVGYDADAAGVLTTGGSLANFTAVVTARRAKLPENFLDGVLYCSDQTHHSVMKAANLAGFSARNLRILPTDDQFRLLTEPLVQQIVEDREAGLQPFMIIASAGTTNTGSIDPLPELADIADEQDLWFHVDGAYGGAFVITERGAERLQGMSRADSITLDPHKGLFLPYGTGCILVRDKEALISAHEMRGDYMPDLDRDLAHLDPFSLSVELSREHRGLKMALPLMLHGVQAFVDELDEKLDLAAVVHAGLSAIDELEVLNVPELSTVAFRLRDESDEVNKALMDAVNEGGRVYLSGTVLRERFALRISILSHRTHAAEIETALGEVQRCIGEFVSS